MTNFGPFLANKGPILNLRPKNETDTFQNFPKLDGGDNFLWGEEFSIFYRMVPTLYDAQIFRKLVTDVRTNERESIGLRDSLETKKFFSHNISKKCCFLAFFCHIYTTRFPKGDIRSQEA